MARELKAHLADGNERKGGGILWDVVAVYPANAKWNSRPAFINGPVVHVASDVARELVTLSGTATGGNRLAPETPGYGLAARAPR